MTKHEYLILAILFSAIGGLVSLIFGFHFHQPILLYMARLFAISGFIASLLVLVSPTPPTGRN